MHCYRFRKNDVVGKNDDVSHRDDGNHVDRVYGFYWSLRNQRNQNLGNNCAINHQLYFACEEEERIELWYNAHNSTCLACLVDGQYKTHVLIEVRTREGFPLSDPCSKFDFENQQLARLP